MDADEVLWPADACGQAGDRQRRGVRAEQRVGCDVWLDLPPDLVLERRILEHRLDHEVGTGRVLRPVTRVDQREQRVSLRLRGAPALNGLGHELLRVALAALRRLERYVLEHDLDPGLGAHVGDRRAHHAGAQDHDLARAVALGLGGPAAAAVDAVEVKPERLNHVLCDLAGRQLDEVARLDLEGVVKVDLRPLHRGRHDRKWCRHVGTLELLAQVGGERGQVGGKRRGRWRATGDPVLLSDVPRLPGRGAGGCLL